MECWAGLVEFWRASSLQVPPLPGPQMDSQSLLCIYCFTSPGPWVRHNASGDPTSIHLLCPWADLQSSGQGRGCWKVRSRIGEIGPSIGTLEVSDSADSGDGQDVDVASTGVLEEVTIGNPDLGTSFWLWATCFSALPLPGRLWLMLPSITLTGQDSER